MRDSMLRMRTTEVSRIRCTLRGCHRRSRWVILQKHGVRTLIKNIVLAIQLTWHGGSVSASTARDALILDIRLMDPIIVALICDRLLQRGRNHVVNVGIRAPRSSHLLKVVSGIDRFGLGGLHRWIWSVTSFVLPQMLIVLDLSHQLFVELDCSVWLTEHVFIVEKARVQRPQDVRIRPGRVLILI